MEHPQAFKLAADLMIGDMIAGQPNLNSLNFNIDYFGETFTVYYQKQTIDDNPVWVMVSYEKIA